MSPIKFDVKSAAFRCSTESWFQTLEERREWDRLVLDVVMYAFGQRSATFVTISPAEWSIGNSLPRPRNVSRGPRRYLLNEVDECTAALLAQVVESEDFQRGLLWIAASSRNEDELLAEVARIEAAAVEEPSADRELVLLLDDSRCIHWLSPSRDVEILKRRLATIVGLHGL